jgi:peptidyl-dipeptidase A
MPNQTLDAFIAQQTDNLKPHFIRIAELQWQASTTGAPDVEAQLSEATKQLRLLLSDMERYAELNILMAGVNTHPLTLRQAELLNNALREHRVSPALIEKITELEVEIQGDFVKFRASVNGQSMPDNDLKQILRESDDVALRKAAWEASKQIGAQVAEKVRQLARLRNEAAKEAGFSNYYTMRLELDELDEIELFSLLDQLKTGLDPAWQTYKGELDAKLAARFNIAVEDLRPWHYADPFFQEGQPSDVKIDPYFADKDLVQLTRDYFSAIGLEIDDILARSDLYEREGKEQHAFCTDIDRAGDVRVLCNVRPDAYWADTMLHEFGHAVYDKYIDPALPFFLKTPAHTLTTEAIALMSGNLIKEQAWLARYAGVPQAEAQQLSAALAESSRTQQLIFARWVFVMCHFERALYLNPDRDLNTLWWDLVECYQSVRRPDVPSGFEWAAKIHLGIAPVYYHNYLMGAMMAAQLRDYMLKHIAGGSEEAYVSDPRIGQFLIDKAFMPGAVRDWRGWLRHATGESLSAEAYIAKLHSAKK